MYYPWYDDSISFSSQIEQGDFIPKCPIIIPPKIILQDSEPEVDVLFINSIVLSQSCDLANNKLEIVLVCPYYPLNKFIEDSPNNLKKSKVMKNMVKGNYAGYHLLNKQSGIFDEPKVVDFKNVYGIHFEVLKDIAGSLEKRVRLLPPYREHLSQAFARYFMRVGLPQDIEIED